MFAGGGGGGGGDGGENVPAVFPEQVGEAAAVGVAGGVYAAVIDGAVGFERGEDSVEEFEVAAALEFGGALPACFFAFGVGEAAGGVEALHVDDDGFGPEVMEVEHGGGVLHGAAVTVESEDDGVWFGG